MSRPHSLQELASSAEIAFDARISLNSYLRSIEALLAQARNAIKEDLLEDACIFLIRVARLACEDLPRHPQWKLVESAKRKRVQNAGQDALSLLSDVKPKISDRYERWRASEEAKPKAAKLVRRPRADSRAKDGLGEGSSRSTSPTHSRLSSPVAPRATPLPYSQSQQDMYGAIRAPDYDYRGDRAGYERMIDDLTHNLRHTSFPMPDRPERKPVSPRKIPPHLLATGGSNADAPSTSSSSYLTVHQRQQGHVDHGYAAPTRATISYPSLERGAPLSSAMPPPQPQMPHIFRSTSLLSLPTRPPRPPKIKSGTSLVPASRLGKAMTESGQPLRDMLCPSQLIDNFVRLASDATERNCETCGLLLGTLSDDIFTVKVLLLPKQRGTPDTCETTDEEAIFNFQDARDLQTLAWIHSHPRQSCFLSSLDLHTHYGNQQMLAESVAIVCAPRKTPSVGIFRLTSPPGLDIIGSCTAPGAFHPHEKAPLYTDADYAGGAGHFHIVEGMALDVVDMR